MIRVLVIAALLAAAVTSQADAKKRHPARHCFTHFINQAPCR